MTAAALLRWEWQSGDETELDRDDFVEQFRRWAAEHVETHHCLVVERGAHIVGMGWLAITPRVPTIRDNGRLGAEIQAVYVTPEERGQGLGGMLIDALVGRARSQGLERVTVHSSVGAISAYRRGGFDTSPKLLQHLPSAPSPARWRHSPGASEEGTRPNQPSRGGAPIARRLR